MHELYIAESILKSVAESLPTNVPAASVLEVRVQVGQLDAVIPDTLTFSFDAIKPSHGMPGAMLVVEQIDVLCKCKDCGCEFSLDLPVFICPHCNRGRVDVLRGRGIMLTGITAEDPEGEK